MKRILAFMCALILGLLMIGCGGGEDTIKIYVPDGAPSLAIAKLMHDGGELGGRKIDVVVVDPSTINTYLMSKKADFAIVPTNVAANAYNKELGYRMVAAVTHGNLYIVGKTEVLGDSISERLDGLKGKKIGIIGETGTPNMMFKYIMDSYDISYEVYNDSVSESKVYARYYGDGGLALAALIQGQVDFALLGEPAVGSALSKIAGSSIAFDLGDIWEDITDGDRLYPQAVLVASDAIDDEQVTALVDILKSGEDWAEENPDLALDAVKANTLDGAASTMPTLTKEIIERCNIRIIASSEAKSSVNFYLEAMMEVGAASIGGKVPNDEFYR